MLLAAFLGGAVSHWVLSTPAAVAADDKDDENIPPVTGTKIVTASAFIVPSKDGFTAAKLSLSDAGTPALVINREVKAVGSVPPKPKLKKWLQEAFAKTG